MATTKPQAQRKGRATTPATAAPEQAESLIATWTSYLDALVENGSLGDITSLAYELLGSLRSVEALADKLESDSPKPGPGGFIADGIREALRNPLAQPDVDYTQENQA